MTGVQWTIIGYAVGCTLAYAAHAPYTITVFWPFRIMWRLITFGLSGLWLLWLFLLGAPIIVQRSEREGQ